MKTRDYLKINSKNDMYKANTPFKLNVSYLDLVIRMKKNLKKKIICKLDILNKLIIISLLLTACASRQHQD